jgi:hypothetical protein
VFIESNGIIHEKIGENQKFVNIAGMSIHQNNEDLQTVGKQCVERELIGKRRENWRTRPYFSDLGLFGFLLHIVRIHFS